MKAPLHNLVARSGLAAFTASCIGCYPAYPPAYPPGSAYTSASGYPQDAKGYQVPYDESAPAPQQPAPPPARYGVDPGLVIAGAAAVGLLGYALGSHHHHGYYGGYGYYGPPCYPY